MKKNRVILALVLVVLIGFGWMGQLTSAVNQNKAYSTAVKEADECCEKKLYQKAINYYEEALKIKETEEVRNKWFKTYGLALEAEEMTRSKYLKAMNKVIEIYPKRTDLWEALITEYINKKDFKKAKDYYEDAIEAGADKKTISKYKNTIYYSVTAKKSIFSEVLMSSQGYFTVFDGKKWGIMDPSGKWIYDCVYDYAGPAIKKDKYFLSTQKDSRVYDKSKVAQAILSDKDIQTKAISGTIIPICKEGVWSFYDYDKEKNILENFDDVSCFVGGKAAVKKADKWSIVDKSGKYIAENAFDDIKLLGSGEYAVKEIMIASVNGKYGMYNESGKSKNSFAAEDMDVYMGGNIAFKDASGKWGFVNTEGKVVIEPKFDEALSFSNGLAAVKSGENWGFINGKGEVVIDYQYAAGGYFNSKGSCFVGLASQQNYMISLRFKGEK